MNVSLPAPRNHWKLHTETGAPGTHRWYANEGHDDGAPVHFEFELRGRGGEVLAFGRMTHDTPEPLSDFGYAEFGPGTLLFTRPGLSARAWRPARVLRPDSHRLTDLRGDLALAHPDHLCAHGRSLLDSGQACVVVIGQQSAACVEQGRHLTPLYDCPDGAACGHGAQA
ncbi:hypothetical protein [Deinococcus petrolearius]|uniref:Uncharacterized protein n=1 Tax=Deinococcus petrolearius TaxID=1751295 RepID=A0ABW1DMI3_9DEIO